MEALAVKQLFNVLTAALPADGRGSFSFTDEMLKALDYIDKYPSIDRHDIAGILSRLRHNALGKPDPLDEKIRNTPAVFIPFACELLKDRWEVIKDTPRDYTHCSTEANQPYDTFVRRLYTFAFDMKECNAITVNDLAAWMRPLSRPDKDNPKKNILEPNYYALLIPTLTQTIEPISRAVITDIPLNNAFVLSQDETLLISLKNSQDSFARGEGFFNIDVVPARCFTDREKKRIKDKPWELRSKVTQEFLDYIITPSHPAPALRRDTVTALTNMVNRVLALKKDPNLNVEVYEKKYWNEKKPLTKQDVDYLWEAHAVTYRENDRRACDALKSEKRDKVEEWKKRVAAVAALEQPFKDALDKAGPAQTKETLDFLVDQAHKEKIATIASEMLVYYNILEKENPTEYKRLMNQVFFDRTTQPKTFHTLMRSVGGSENFKGVRGVACSDVTFSELEELLKHVVTRKREMDESLDPATSSKRPTTPNNTNTAPPLGFAFFAFSHYAKETASSNKPNTLVDTPTDEPTSIAEYTHSPERSTFRMPAGTV